jgi:hypothetical protein
VADRLSDVDTVGDNWFTLQFTDRQGFTFETRAVGVDAPACGERGCDYEDLDKTRSVSRLVGR